MQYSDQLLQAIESYLNGKATATEQQRVNDWYHSFDDAEVSVDVNDADYGKLVEARLKLRVYESTGITVEAKEARTVKLWPRIAAVAAAVALIVLGVYFFNAPSRHLDPTLSSRVSRDLNDIAPGKNGATITLANGKVIQLSDAKTGVVIGNDKLNYDDGTALSGLQPSLPGGERSVELTATTAKGQTYEFTLPDGTHVWLNADSKISFPYQFIGRTRKILLEGEAYFEVAKNKNRPFIVESDGQEVTVLGTHFNISAYKGEGSVRTTLLEGSVSVRHAVGGRHPEFSSGSRTGKVSTQGVNSSSGILTPKELRSKTVQDDGQGGETSIILKPNQQSVIYGSNRIAIKDVDPNEAIDWKNGDFVFKGESLESVMRRVARWYDVEVSYVSDELKNITVGGFVSRSRSISAVLELMERTGKVNFKIEGRKIIVTKLK